MMMMQLLRYLKTLNIPVEILSATGCKRTPEFHEEISDQKMEWLEANGIHFQANFTPSGAMKGEYAKKWHNPILIDDTAKCLMAFQKEGGFVVPHIGAKESIQILQKYFHPIGSKL